MAGHIEWGLDGNKIGFLATQVDPAVARQMVPRLSTGLEVTREGREGSVPFIINDLSAGLQADSSIRSWTTDARARPYYNEGLCVHIPGKCFLPPLLQTDNDRIAVNASGYRAANLRVNSAMFNQRWYATMGPYLIKDTSSSDPTPLVPSTNDNIADNVRAMWVGYINNTRGLFIATDGQTDDIKFTTDPSANSISWTSAVTYGDASDCVYAAGYSQVWNGTILKGQINGVNGDWWIPRDAAVPVTSPTPIVYRDTKDVANTANASVLYGPYLPDAAENAFPSTPDPASALVSFTNPTNALIDDTNYATQAVASGVNSDMMGLFLNWHLAHRLPAGGYRPVGAVYTSYDFVSNADDNIFDQIVSFAHGSRPVLVPATAASAEQTYGSVTLVGANKASSIEKDWTSVDDTAYGGSVDTFAAGLTLDFLRQGDIGIYHSYREAGATSTVSYDYGTLAIYLQPTGFQMSSTQGGHTCGFLPSNPSVLPYLRPKDDDKSGINAMRELEMNTYAFDPERQAPVGVQSYPDTGLNYVGILTPFSGGLAVAGGRNHQIWNQVKIVDANERVIDLAFPKQHGNNPLTITQMTRQGNVLIVDTAYTNGTQAQRWMYFDGKWNASWVQQSKSESIATEPLLWATCTNGLQTGYGYRFFPESTTHIAAAWEEIPQDFFSDVHLGTATSRQQGELYLEMLYLDIGPAEANKQFMAVNVQSNKVDDGTAYGTMKVKVDTFNPASGLMVTDAINETFDAAAECFINRNFYSSNNPGIAYRFAKVKLYATSGGTTKTPQILPVNFTMAHQWVHSLEYAFVLDRTEYTNLVHLYQRFIEAANAGPAHALLGAGFEGVPTLFVDLKATYTPAIGVEPPGEADVKTAAVIFRQVPGASHA